MGKYKFVQKISLIITICCATNFAAANAHNEADELLKMQEFHMQQAYEKITKEDLAHAWGDLAYVVCQIPNHHEALKKMAELAPKLDKREELSKYLEKAVKLFPNDQELKNISKKVSM